VLELYGVSMIIIIVSWVIYSIFGSKTEEENASHDPYAELTEQQERQPGHIRHHHEHSSRRRA